MRPLYYNPLRPDMPYTYLMTTGGGVLHGDRQRTDLRFGAGTSAHVTTQAHTKVYRMESGYATALREHRRGRGRVRRVPARTRVIPFADVALLPAHRGHGRPRSHRPARRHRHGRPARPRGTPRLPGRRGGPAHHPARRDAARHRHAAPGDGCGDERAGCRGSGDVRPATTTSPRSTSSATGRPPPRSPTPSTRHWPDTGSSTG